MMDRVRHGAGALIALVALAELRPASGVMAAASIGFALAAWAVTRRAWIAAVATILAGLTAYGIATRPSVQALAMSQTRFALVRHVGHVKSLGISYRASDERFYRGGNTAPDSMNAAEGARFLIMSAWYFFAAPLPQHIASMTGMLIVPLQLVWYALLMLAGIGLPTALRRDALVTWLWIGYVMAGVITIAPNSGNIGTLIRHRDMIVPFIIGLGSVGLMRLLAALTPDPGAWRHAASGRSLERDLCHAAD